MIELKAKYLVLVAATFLFIGCDSSAEQSKEQKEAPESIEMQRGTLADNTAGKGFGPQSPRDIDSAAGINKVIFSPAPHRSKMNLCNIHFHKNAEHRGGEFTKYAGDGNGQGGQTGYKFSGELGKSELQPIDQEICPGKYGSLVPGDTIELHYVYSTAKVFPGPTLGACLSNSIGNPQLRVETQVHVLVSDAGAADFRELTKSGVEGVYYQALNIPGDESSVQYSGSTTGPSYNETGSPLQVTWNVRREVTKVNISTVGAWCEHNVYNETGAHGVRNLIVNVGLLSEIN